MRGFNFYNVFSPDINQAKGGASILVRQGVIHSQIPLQTNLQAVAVQLSLFKTITLCSIYVPPSDNLRQQELDDLVQQLPKPFILLGDFNSHNPLWGSISTNDKGKKIEDFIANNNLSLFNDGSDTYLHPGSGTYSAIDLSITDPSILNDFQWSVHSDMCGSDHFPIVLESIVQAPEEHYPRWKFSKADWGTFSSLCSQKLTFEITKDTSDPLKLISDCLIAIANETIPKSTGITRINKPWFNDTCRAEIKARKKAERNFSKHPTPVNLDMTRKVRAKARRIINNERRTSWRSYVSKLNSRTPVSKVWNMINRIKGKGSRSTIQHLTVNGDLFTAKHDIANKLAESISKNSSSSNYVPAFQKYQKEQEKRQINFKSDNAENYNEQFSLSELKTALTKAHIPQLVQIMFIISCSNICLNLVSRFCWRVITIYGKLGIFHHLGTMLLLCLFQNLVRIIQIPLIIAQKH